MPVGKPHLFDGFRSYAQTAKHMRTTGPRSRDSPPAQPSPTPLLSCSFVTQSIFADFVAEIAP